MGLTFFWLLIVAAFMEHITVQTRDGAELPATLFESNSGLPGKGPVVLISSATAVPRRFYRHFAQYLADNGARAVMTYDYRGINGDIGHWNGYRLRMTDWATQDLPAAVDKLQALYPDHPMTGLGHSFGGQALGLSGAASRFVRYMTICSGSGYLGHTREPRKLWWLMNFVSLPLAFVFGKMPRFAGLGEPLPFGAFNQWRNWCNQPNYFMDDETIAERDCFEHVKIPIAFAGFEDDDWATRASTEAMMKWYANAQATLRWFTTAEAGRPVGHFGFFRREHETGLWPQIGDWLIRD